MYVTIDFDELLHETDDAYKLKIGFSIVWLPKYACRNLDDEDGTVELLEKVAFDEGLV